MKEEWSASPLFHTHSKMTYVPTRHYTQVGDTQVLTYEAWWLEGQSHRVDGPALREWTIVNGMAVLTREAWRLRGQYHRVDGPACQQWAIVNRQPVLFYEVWCLEGKHHRADGPSIRMWRIVNGLPVLTLEQWWLQDKKVEPYALPFIQDLITTHLQQCGLVIWPGLMDLIGGYLV